MCLVTITLRGGQEFGSNLFNNQEVTGTTSNKVTTWTYTPVKYWPTQGHIDFLAYAPYDATTALNTTSDGTASKKTSKINFIVAEQVGDQKDLLWANVKEQKKTNDPVKFTFNHALARLGFDITANQDLEENGAVIKVQEVELYGASEISGVFVMAGYLNLENGDWTLADNGISWFYTWTPDGTVDGKKFDNSIIYKLSAPPQLDHEHDKVTNHDDSYIFIIPQKKPDYFNLKITYTVVQGNFKEDVTVTKNLLEVPGVSDPSFTFEGGKAYVFHLKLSLDPINFNVTTKVEDWKEGKNE